jgi:hypothetical protein
MRKNKARA